MINLLDKKRSGLLIAGLISFVTLVVYLPTLKNGFVNWDDPHYVFLNTHIRSMNPEFFRWAFFDASTVYWHPLTWTSHALDYAVWGLNPFGHHLTSIILHALNTFIVVILSIRFFEISSGCSKGVGGGYSRIIGPYLLPQEWLGSCSVFILSTLSPLPGLPREKT